ncbi:MAG: thioredoxin domain-containing protein [Trueperaceae bacterium]
MGTVMLLLGHAPVKPKATLADAPATIVAFKDFKCPVCQRFEESVVPLIEQRLVEPGKAKLVFINLQFIAPDSVTAGIAGECAYQQDEQLFWEYKTIIFRTQGNERETWATPERLTQLARDYVPDLDAEASLVATLGADAEHTRRRHSDFPLP